MFLAASSKPSTHLSPSAAASRASFFKPSPRPPPSPALPSPPNPAPPVFVQNPPKMIFYGFRTVRALHLPGVPPASPPLLQGQPPSLAAPPRPPPLAPFPPTARPSSLASTSLRPSRPPSPPFLPSPPHPRPSLVQNPPKMIFYEFRTVRAFPALNLCSARLSSLASRLAPVPRPPPSSPPEMQGGRSTPLNVQSTEC